MFVQTGKTRAPSNPVGNGAAGARIRLSDAEFTVTDGPFSETKELIGGFAIIQASSKQEAIEHARYFLQAAGGGETEIRQLHDVPASASGKPWPGCPLVHATASAWRDVSVNGAASNK